MNISYKIICFLFVLIIIGCKESSINPIESRSFQKIEFRVTGGEGGIHQETTISENGEVVFIYHYKSYKYIVKNILSKQQLDSLGTVLNENKIFSLQDEYKSSQPVMDAFSYKINYSSLSGRNKNIIIEDVIELPNELKTIIKKLSEINNYIESNPDYGTLTTMWDSEEIIKRWNFPDIKLHRKSYHYSVINSPDSVLAYFEEIRKNVGYNVLFLSQDSLYSIYDGGMEYGYFNAYEVFEAKLYNNYFSDDISIIKESGIVKSMNEWVQKNILLNNTYVFVIDKLEDNGRAIKVRLISGKPYND